MIPRTTLTRSCRRWRRASGTVSPGAIRLTVTRPMIAERHERRRCRRRSSDGLGRRSVGERPDPPMRHAGSQRRVAEHRAPGHGRGVRRLVDATRGGGGIATPTRAELARFDRKRKKKGSTRWTNPHDPDANITKMKDGRTHLAHSACGGPGETVQDGDTTTETLITAAEVSITEVVGAVPQQRTMVAFRTLGSGVTSRNRIAGGATGKGRRRHARRCMPIVGGFGAPAGNGCCANAARTPQDLYETGRMRRVHLPGLPTEACARAYLRQ